MTAIVVSTGSITTTVNLMSKARVYHEKVRMLYVA